MNAQILLSVLRVEGAVVNLDNDGSVVIVPKRPLPAHLIDSLRANKAAVVRALEDEAGLNAALLDWLPLRGSKVRDVKTGKEGVLWGVHGHGVTVDFGSGTCLLTLDPRHVELT